MGVLPRARGGSRTFSRESAVRAWLALRLQKRRRERAAPAAPVPIIYGGAFTWDTTEVNYADTTICWTIDYRGFPVASVEVWFRNSGSTLERIATVPSSDGTFHHTKVVYGEDDVFYRLCYRNGDVVGPFSEEFRIVIEL
jgi:hypothetical protein